MSKPAVKILCTAYRVGHIHDFRLLKIPKVRFQASQLCLADKGYQGIAKIHSHSCIPTKKPQGADLSTGERQHNRNLAQLRVVGEHINRRLKIFRILKEQYRNRRKRFGKALQLNCWTSQLSTCSVFLIRARSLMYCILLQG